MKPTFIELTQINDMRVFINLNLVTSFCPTSNEQTIVSFGEHEDAFFTVKENIDQVLAIAKANNKL